MPWIGANDDFIRIVVEISPPPGECGITNDVVFHHRHQKKVHDVIISFDEDDIFTKFKVSLTPINTITKNDKERIFRK